MRTQTYAGIIGLATLFLLVSGLSSIELQAIGFTPRIDLSESSVDFPELPSLAREFREFLQFALRVFLIAMLPISMIYLIFSPSGRKRILVSLLFLSVNMYVLLVLLRGIGLSQLNAEPLASSELPAFETGESVEFQPIDPPGWLAPSIAFALAGGAAAIVFAARRRGHPVETIATVAERAISDLDSGREFDDTILNCYYQMCDHLAKSRGIRRGRAMTPREFENFLLREGYSTKGVSALTRLFEQVRYGDARLGEDHQREARHALSIISGAAHEN